MKSAACRFCAAPHHRVTFISNTDFGKKISSSTKIKVSPKAKKNERITNLCRDSSDPSSFVMSPRRKTKSQRKKSVSLQPIGSLSQIVRGTESKLIH
jgi:hypothetical protein